MKPNSKNVSATYHATRTRVESSRIARDKKVDRMKRDTAQTVILSVIILSMLVVILAVLLMHFTNPERNISRKIEELASNYYENKIFKSIADSKPDSYADVIKKYEETGFSPVTLRQLLLFDSPVKTDTSKTINKYCDENASIVHYYPVSPYGVKNYRTEYKLSCTF